MLLNNLTNTLDRLFNKTLALQGDPVGLQVGKLENDISKALITLDINFDVIDEAIKEKVDLIIAHHPLLFDPVKNILGSDTKGRMLFKLIENNIAVYIAHTNFDAMHDGLNQGIAEMIGFKNIEILERTSMQWYKFAVFVPPETADAVRDAVFENGGGSWANYSSCSFNTKGTGTFMPLEKARPYSGKKGEVNFVEEIRIECVVEEKNLAKLVNSVIKAHPYEEPAYDICKLENLHGNSSLACKGNLEPAQLLQAFMKNLKKSLNLDFLRFAVPAGIDITNMLVKSAALINGSANAFTDRVAVQNLDCELIIVGELKYSKVSEIVQCGKVLIELGHGESEKIAIDMMHDILVLNSKDLQGLKFIKSKNGFTGWRYYID